MVLGANDAVGGRALSRDVEVDCRGVSRWTLVYIGVRVGLEIAVESMRVSERVGNVAK